MRTIFSSRTALLFAFAAAGCLGDELDHVDEDFPRP